MHLQQIYVVLERQMVVITITEKEQKVVWK
jgi:hypothetical protein